MTSTVPAVGELSEPSVLDALLRPQSVAMIGASRNPTALGGRPLGFMARYGFPGKVYPVNGSAPEVQGLPSYASIKDVHGAPVGDTLTLAAKPAEKPLAGFQTMQPRVFAGLFPVSADDYPALREALDKLRLNDAALFFEPESSEAMGFG